MEDILASIKKVIAEEKELRTAVRNAPPPAPEHDAADEDAPEEVLELDEPVADFGERELEPEPEPLDLGPPLVSQDAAEVSRQKLVQLQEVAATAPQQPQGNPLETMVRDMLRPVLKEWLDRNLPGIVDEHVKREISRITGQGF